MGVVIPSEGFLSEMRTESGPPTISEKGSHGTESESELGGALWERGSAARPHLDLGLAGSPLLLGPAPPSHPISKQRAVLGCVPPSKLQSFTALSGEGIPPTSLVWVLKPQPDQNTLLLRKMQDGFDQLCVQGKQPQSQQEKPTEHSNPREACKKPLSPSEATVSARPLPRRPL